MCLVYIHHFLRSELDCAHHRWLRVSSRVGKSRVCYVTSRNHDRLSQLWRNIPLCKARCSFEGSRRLVILMGRRTQQYGGLSITHLSWKYEFRRHLRSHRWRCILSSTFLCGIDYAVVRYGPVDIREVGVYYVLQVSYFVFSRFTFEECGAASPRGSR